MKNAILTTVLIAATTTLQAQVTVKGWVVTNDNQNEITMNVQGPNKHSLSERAHFKVVVPLDTTITIFFAQANHLTKGVIIDTRLAEGRRKMQFDVQMVPNWPNGNAKVQKKVVRKLIFGKGRGDVCKITSGEGRTTKQQ